MTIDRRTVATRRLHSIVLLLVVAAYGIAGRAGTAGDNRDEPSLAEILQRPVPLRNGIGRASEPITTSSDGARAYYNQGLAYLHSYVWIEAARSFNEALRRDANLAMAHLGSSYALSQLGLADEAAQAARRAQALGRRASHREKARIAIRASQLEAAARPGDPALRAAFRRQLDAALASYPADVELLLVAGLAQEPSRDSHGMDAGSSSLRFYERALALKPDYFAIHHYLTHAYENVNRLDRALVHADRFARSAFAVPHARHMYGHILARSDRMNEATAEFVKADALETAYLNAERIPPEYDWHYAHNLDLLGASYQYAGRMRLAEPVLRRSFGLPSPGSPTLALNKKAWVTFLLARGRATDALEAARTMTTAPAPLVQALGHILSSRSKLKLNQLDSAAEEGDNGLHHMRAIGSRGGVLVPEFQLTQGEFLLRSNQGADGRAMLRDAALKLRAQSTADGWMQTLFGLEAVARTARELGDWALAGEIAEQMRQHDAPYAGTQYALAMTFEQAGDRAAARLAFAEAVRRWVDADPDLPELAEARRRLARLAGAAHEPHHR